MHHKGMYIRDNKTIKITQAKDESLQMCITKQTRIDFPIILSICVKITTKKNSLFQDPKKPITSTSTPLQNKLKQTSHVLTDTTRVINPRLCASMRASGVSRDPHSSRKQFAKTIDRSFAHWIKKKRNSRQPRDTRLAQVSFSVPCRLVLLIDGSRRGAILLLSRTLN